MLVMTHNTRVITNDTRVIGHSSRLIGLKPPVGAADKPVRAQEAGSVGLNGPVIGDQPGVDRHHLDVMTIHTHVPDLGRSRRPLPCDAGARWALLEG